MADPGTMFQPAHARLELQQQDIVVLPSAAVSIYLDRVLKELGLVSEMFLYFAALASERSLTLQHTEARTSFIT